MKKIVIVGSSGAGKSTLARDLSSIVSIKVFHMDRFFWRDKWKKVIRVSILSSLVSFFWQYNWKKETRDERIDTLQKLIREKTWIIEGTYLNTSKIHLEAADTIIFLDISRFLCFWRIIKRYGEYHGLHRRDIPDGCTDRLTLRLMLKVLIFPMRERRKLKHMLRNYKYYESKQIIELHSNKEVEDFLAKQMKLSGVVSKTRTRLPVIAGR